MKRRIIAALAAIGLAVGLGLVAASPAQAHDPITYVADCPGDAVSQQMVIRTWSPDYIAVEAWQDPYGGTGQIVPLGTAGPGDNGQVFYMTIQSFDTVQYKLTSAGNLNYFYHVDCQYAAPSALDVKALPNVKTFADFGYWAACPAGTAYQQLVVVANNSGAGIRIEADRSGNVGWVPSGASVYYFPIQYQRAELYYFSGAGSLNWFYHVDCF